MLEREPELDLPAPPGADRSGRRHRFDFAGFSLAQLLGGALLLAALSWAIWATRTIATLPTKPDIVSVRLSAIVGEYVQAQARSASPPARVEAEMRTFMASLDKELQRRSDTGQVVLVGEAVLSKNVPDVTDQLRRAVYASGIALPRQASPAEIELRLRPSAEGLAIPPSGAAIAQPGQSPFGPPTSGGEPVGGAPAVDARGTAAMGGPDAGGAN